MNQGGQEAERKLSGEIAGRWQQHRRRRSAFNLGDLVLISHRGTERREEGLSGCSAGSIYVPIRLPFFPPIRANPSTWQDILVFLQTRIVRMNFSHYFTCTSIKYTRVYFLLQF